MNQNFIITRLQEIEKAIEQISAQHSALQGAKNELINLLSMMDKSAIPETTIDQSQENSV